MQIQQIGQCFSRPLIALAVLAAWGAAQAADEPDIGALTEPGKSVSIGVGGTPGASDKDRARFGLFNGLRDHSVDGLAGFSYFSNNLTTGRWTAAEGLNLGLDSREVRGSIRQLGDWKVYGEFNELVRHDPRTINTASGLQNTTTPSIAVLPVAGTGNEINLQLKRQSYTLGGEKVFGGSFLFEANFKNEDKDGSRVFGRGYACNATVCTSANSAVNQSWALLLTPEPVNSNIKQVDAKLSWRSDRVQLNGGYYGTFYKNDNGNISPIVPGALIGNLGLYGNYGGGGTNPVTLSPAVAGGTSLQRLLSSPLALQPDNQAHQFYVGGNLRFTPETRANFKLAYTHATQDKDFNSQGLSGAPAGVANLGGELDTILAQAGISTRPTTESNLLANVRYEERDNRTPISLYNCSGNPCNAALGPNANQWTNNAQSPKRLTLKGEGSYQFPYGYRGTVGVQYESKDEGVPVATDTVGGITGIRQKTYERSWFGEARKNMSDDLTGALKYAFSHRDGSSWLKPNAGGLPGVTAVSDAVIFSPTGAFPTIMENRDRHELKLSANWDATSALSVQGYYTYAFDSYSAPTNHGLRDTKAQFAGFDATYVISDAWKFAGYASYTNQYNVGFSTGYDTQLKQITGAAGFRLTGRPSQRWQVISDLSWTRDINQYNTALDPAVSANNNNLATGGAFLPPVHYDYLQLKLTADYAIQKNAFIRANLIHYRTYLDEWTWGYNGVPFTYNDNTTITSKQQQNVTFLGVSYVYKFQ